MKNIHEKLQISIHDFYRRYWFCYSTQIWSLDQKWKWSGRNWEPKRTPQLDLRTYFQIFISWQKKNNKTKSHHSTVVEVSDSLHKELQSLPACWVSGRGAQTPSHTQWVTELDFDQLVLIKAWLAWSGPAILHSPHLSESKRKVPTGNRTASISA